MELNVSLSETVKPVDVEKVAEFIVSLQKENGEIPWSQGGKTDPWDHIESAMGLSVAGFTEEAERAYSWLVSTQLADGSWWSEIKARRCHQFDKRNQLCRLYCRRRLSSLSDYGQYDFS
jgi:hypothetical protein